MAKPPVKAQRLAAELEQCVRSGEWRAGSWLPSERQLAERYEASRSTVRQALAQLVAVGVIELQEGAGARVPLAGAAPTGSLDAAGLAEQLEAIRGELREMNARLGAIETRGRERDVPPGG